MRFLYWKYYREERRGFTDAEFEQACEIVAGTALTRLFEYVYTTKELDYTTYLNYAGLRLDREDSISGAGKFTLRRIDEPDSLQLAILTNWLGK